jgi:hypothetical protein
MVIINIDKVHEMRSQLDFDPQMREEFTEFAATQYVSESLLFLEDTNTYRKLYYDKAPTWHVSKARLLVHMYIIVGADLQVNISDEMRSDIIKNLESGAVGQDLFAKAVHDIEHIIERTVWLSFLKQRRSE